MSDLLLTPDQIREAAARMAEILVGYESSLEKRAVLPELDRDSLQRILDEPWPEQGRPLDAFFDEFAEVIVPNSAHIAHPRYLAYVLGLLHEPAHDPRRRRHRRRRRRAHRRRPRLALTEVWIRDPRIGDGHEESDLSGRAPCPSTTEDLSMATAHQIRDLITETTTGTVRPVGVSTLIALSVLYFFIII